MHYVLTVFVPKGIDIEDALAKYDETDEDFYENDYSEDSELRRFYEEKEMEVWLRKDISSKGYLFDERKENIEWSTKKPKEPEDVNYRCINVRTKGIKTYKEFVKVEGYFFDDEEEKAFEAYNPNGIYDYYTVVGRRMDVSSLFNGHPHLNTEKYKEFCALWDKYHDEEYMDKHNTGIDSFCINSEVSLMNEFDSRESYAQTASIPLVNDSCGYIVTEGYEEDSVPEIVRETCPMEERADIILQMCAEHSEDYDVFLVNFHD